MFIKVMFIFSSSVIFIFSFFCFLFFSFFLLFSSFNPYLYFLSPSWKGFPIHGCEVEVKPLEIRVDTLNTNFTRQHDGNKANYLHEKVLWSRGEAFRNLCRYT